MANGGKVLKLDVKKAAEAIGLTTRNGLSLRQGLRAVTKSKDEPGDFGANMGFALGLGTGNELYRRSLEDIEDPFVGMYDTYRLKEPPYSFQNLYMIAEESDVLQACVDAMAKNVDGFGYQMVFLGDDLTEKTGSQAIQQFTRCRDFFDHVNESESFGTIRQKMRQDLEFLGNGAFEVVRNNFGQVQMMYHLPFKYLRMSMAWGNPVTKIYHIPRDGKIVALRVKKFFRRFAQVRQDGRRLRWFKEFGDPRVLDTMTGQYWKKGDDPVKFPASEVLHFKIPFGGLAYGLPRWIGAMLSIMGKRQAEFVNYDLFENQGIPPMAVLVSGGVLTDESVATLQNMIQGMRGVTNFNRVMLLEALAEGMGLENTGTAKLELKELSGFRKEDQMFTRYLDGCEKACRHRFRLPPLYVGAAETFCIAEQYQTLTENGWKFYHEVQPTEKIATINPENGELEYQIPTGPFVFDVDGEMYHFQNKAVDMLVTPNHEMYLSLRRGYPWQKVEAKDVFEGKNPRYNVCFKTAPSGYQAPDQVDFALRLWHRREEGLREVEESRRIPMEDFLTLVGFYIADGSTSGPGEPRYHVEFDVLKERKITILRGLLNRFGEHRAIRVSECVNTRGHTKFTVSDRMLTIWLSENCGRHAWEKQIPTEFLKLNRKQSEMLLSALIAGDGNITGGEHCWPDLPMACRYVTTSFKLAEQVQLLAFKCGYRAVLAEGYDVRPNRHDIYYVNMKRSNDVLINNFQHEVVPYRGKVYCFEVPNHLFVVRGNGKIGITGNTHATAKAAQTVAEEQVFVPERVQMDECINNQLLPEFNITKWVFKTKGPRIVGAGDITQAVKTFTDAGAFTVNHMIDRANEAFGLEMSHFDAIWADYPVPYVVELIKQGQILGPDIIEGLPPIPIPQVPQLGGTKPSKQLMLPGVSAAPGDSGGPNASPASNPSAAVEKMMASDMFTMEEKGLYKLLLGVQKAIELGHLTDADLQL